MTLGWGIQETQHDPHIFCSNSQWIGLVGKFYRKPWFLQWRSSAFPVIFFPSNSMYDMTSVYFRKIFPYDKQLPLKQLPQSLRQEKITFWQPPWSFSARPWFWTSPEPRFNSRFNSPSRDDPMAKSLGNDDIYIYIYTGWWCNFTILKNDGVKVNGKD